MIEPAAPAKLTRNEGLKEASPTLAGTIAPTLANPALDRFSDDDYEFLKFHGIYQQDDRDKRKVAKEYIFMVRGRLPGGVVSPDHYLVFDKLASTYGNNTLRITSRQGFQFHGVVKSGLGPLMKGINESLATTLAACGDVNRNVMAPPTPAMDSVVEHVQADARRVSDALLPQTPAYHQIWVEGQTLNLDDAAAKDFVDPLYGKVYLPRKFKAAFAIPPLNDVDVFTNCLGFVAIIERGELLGYNLVVGGGLGMSHGNIQTYPRLADVIGFLPPKHLIKVAQAVLTVHRDFGDRTNRKHARLKYVLEEKGVAWFRTELRERLGFDLEAPRPFEFTRQGDLFGWHQQADGRHFLGLYVEAGRIKDTDTIRFKSALRQITTQYRLEIRLTPSQNLLLINVPSTACEGINVILAEHGINLKNQASIIRQTSMACPSMPTCGLGLAESERALPDILNRVEQELAAAGLPDEEIIVRITGCPNGCARSMMSEIGFVGRAPNKYQFYLGGNQSSTRLNRLYKESVRLEDINVELRTLFTRFAQERTTGERFGDFCNRAVLPALEASHSVAPAANPA